MEKTWAIREAEIREGIARYIEQIPLDEWMKLDPTTKGMGISVRLKAAQIAREWQV